MFTIWGRLGARWVPGGGFSAETRTTRRKTRRRGGESSDWNAHGHCGAGGGGSDLDRAAELPGAVLHAGHAVAGGGGGRGKTAAVVGDSNGEPAGFDAHFDGDARGLRV